MLYVEADTAAYFGKLASAREFSRQAATSASGAGEKKWKQAAKLLRRFEKLCMGTLRKPGNTPPVLSRSQTAAIHSMSLRWRSL